MHEVTALLEQISRGNPHASAQVLPLVYAELKSLAKSRMSRERSDHTLQTTALVHEAYMRLVSGDRVQQWDSKGHFFAAAAEAMRRILVEHARHRKTKRRGGDFLRVELDNITSTSADPETVLAVSEALSSLAEIDPQIAELVKLHCFAGVSIPEAAVMLGLPRSTAYAHWTFARGMMSRLLKD
ncbi:MAG: ECF-type sigma factor [Rubripirellula sp.]